MSRARFSQAIFRTSCKPLQNVRHFKGEKRIRTSRLQRKKYSLIQVILLCLKFEDLYSERRFKENGRV